MALTLLDVMRQKKDEFEAAVVETFALNCDISRKLPLTTIGTLEVSTRRTRSAATIGFRKRGQAFGAVTGGGYDVVSDAVFSMGATIDIDKADMRDKSPVVDIMTERTREGVKAAANTFNYAFINGDHAVDEDSFEGVKVRLATVGAAQTIYGNTSAAELDVKAAIAANTTATLQTFLDKIDDAIIANDGGTADVALTDTAMIRTLKAALRRLNINKDAEPQSPGLNEGLGQRRTSATPNQKPIYTYNGVDFYDMGLQADQVTKIIGTDTINGKACTPIYFLKFGEPYIHGIQQYSMEVSKPILQPDGVTYRTVIDWPVGLRHAHPRFGTVLKGLLVA